MWQFALLLVSVAQAPLLGEPSRGDIELPAPQAATEDDFVDFPIQGEFDGELLVATDRKLRCGAQVVALGGGTFHLALYPGGLPGAGWERSAGVYRAPGRTEQGFTRFVNDRWEAECSASRILFRGAAGEHLGSLEKSVRQSPSLGTRPPAKSIILFDGRGAAEFAGADVDPRGCLQLQGVTPTRRAFGDIRLHVEFQTPFAPRERGQGRCNSGIFLQGRYEIQILDSFGLEGLKNEAGGIYRVADPLVNASFPPLAWQTYDIEFRQPRFDADGRKTRNARISVHHNGILVQDRTDVFRTTASDSPPESPGPHPLVLQGRSPRVLFRNLWLIELPVEE